MSKNVSKYIKVLEDVYSELKANAANLQDTTISYRDAYTIAEALDEIDVSDKIYVRRDNLQSAIERAIDNFSDIIAERVMDDITCL